MKHSALKIISGILVLLAAAVQGVSAAELVTLENEIQTDSAFSIGFETWAVIFGLSVVLAILSFAKFGTNTSAEFFGAGGFVLSGLAALSIPYLSHTEYIMESVALDAETVAQVVTPVVVSESSWFLIVASVFIVIMQLLNCIRIFSGRIIEASNSEERRCKRREELFGKY